MKQYYFLAVLVMAVLSSCSSSDDGPNSGNEPVGETNYFSVENDQYWIYDVEGDFPGRDSLYVANDTVVNGTSYKKFKTKELAFGFFSGSLSGNAVRKSGDKVMVSGSTNLALLEGFPIDLAVTDFVIFKESASTNEELGSFSGSFDYQYEDIPLTFNYTMKSVFQESLTSYNVPGRGTYQDVKVIKVMVNLNVGGVVSFQGINFPFTLMEPQNVVVSTQYYAKNFGMVYCDTQINYELVDVSQLGEALPFPSSGSQNIKEYLATDN
ncbi:hypothetical protein ACI6PS_15035 [Flavobacterium sp. PLA-1-15]|uniref:hypothetical protein n=1 Tax=Flavobacterium sp. PLA-1-15 TaxID=3380533 RepID=UPI003B7EF200